jgi:hypothetical protein
VTAGTATGDAGYGAYGRLMDRGETAIASAERKADAFATALSPRSMPRAARVTRDSPPRISALLCGDLTFVISVLSVAILVFFVAVAFVAQFDSFSISASAARMLFSS